jgi:transcriptional regulator with XRE-family HTH domain
MSEITFTSNLIKQFQKRRYELGLTQPEVDQRLGVASGLCAKWEIGNRKPTLFNAYCWAEALGCDIKLEIKDESLRD